MRTHKVYFSGGAGMHTLTKRVLGKGVGAVILDGGIGGQSSYMGGIVDYLHTTSHTPLSAYKSNRGEGLGKLSAKLSGLNIKSQTAGPKRKPIAFSI
jgi:hypothetical protein